jgi:uncharacterized iron-regulated membrane protein
MKVDESAVPSRRAKKPTVGGEDTPAERTRQRAREMSWSRAMFYSHLWFGVLFTVVLLVIGVTGIVLNHKRELGIMPDPEHQPMGAFAESLPLHELANRALAATGLPPDVNSIDRMDVRPRNGFVKIRFRDAASSEATVDLATGAVIHIGPRGDVFMEKLHSGEIFGSNGVLLSDAGAAGLIILLISGYWLWLKPRFRR